MEEKKTFLKERVDIVHLFLEFGSLALKTQEYTIIIFKVTHDQLYICFYKFTVCIILGYN